MGPLLGRGLAHASGNSVPAHPFRSHHDRGRGICRAGQHESWRMWYWLAIKFGEARMRRFIDRYSRWLTLDWAEIERGQALFRKHGSIIVLVARMLPTLRSLISIPAGLFGMSLARFLIFSTIGTAGWTAALAGGGYFLGSQFKDIEKWLGLLSTVVIVGIVLTYVWRLVRWKATPADARSDTHPEA